MKLSIVIPVYYNEPNLWPLYKDIKEKIISRQDIECEIVMVNDGSKDKSYQIMQEISKEDKRVSVEISGYLVSKDSLICSSTAASEDNSRFSDLRARRGAFKKSVKYIYDSMKNKF